MRLSEKDFLDVIENMPLVSIDLVVVDKKSRILMGKRVNSPAQYCWFVPGGRIIKGETLDSALNRIAREEINQDLYRSNGRLVGIFDHYYKENFADVDGIHTQYIVLAFEFFLDLDSKNLPLGQHSHWQWVCESESKIAHTYSANYFHAIKKIDNTSYSIMNSRRDSFNNLLWQTPVLSLVAQAFLFTIILSDKTNSISRTIASLLSLTTSIASVQLLVKHRYAEREIAIELDSIEKLCGRYNINRYRKGENWFVGLSSYRIWLMVLAIFGVAALITLITLWS
ncbi:MAG: NUDIX domain-containing protein [Acidobacteriota bacterium]|nr:NUDIX domain-containing protein [Acidobacteriota bacterium]